MWMSPLLISQHTEFMLDLYMPVLRHIKWAFCRVQYVYMNYYLCDIIQNRHCNKKSVKLNLLETKVRRFMCFRTRKPDSRCKYICFRYFRVKFTIRKQFEIQKEYILLEIWVRVLQVTTIKPCGCVRLLRTLPWVWWNGF